MIEYIHSLCPFCLVLQINTSSIYWTTAASESIGNSKDKSIRKREYIKDFSHVISNNFVSYLFPYDYLIVIST